MRCGEVGEVGEEGSWAGKGKMALNRAELEVRSKIERFQGSWVSLP